MTTETTIRIQCHGCSATIETPVGRVAADATLADAGWFLQRWTIGRHHRSVVLCPACRPTCAETCDLCGSPTPVDDLTEIEGPDNGQPAHVCESCLDQLRQDERDAEDARRDADFYWRQ